MNLKPQPIISMRIYCLTALAIVLLNSLISAENQTKGEPVAPFTTKIKKGEYVWDPAISPAGPVVIIVSLPEQMLSVYRNGVRIGRSTISSGKEGHHTPSGVFTILQKLVDHTSTIFKGAKMPYMERLTWSGVAMHAGHLPGYPASHGCVRLPLDFAKKLYTVTSNGTTVIVTEAATAPGILFTAEQAEEAPPGGVVWTPEKSPTGPLSIIVSSADGAAYVYRAGIEIGRAPVSGLGVVNGWYVYSALNDVDDGGRHKWFTTTSTSGSAPELQALVKGAIVDAAFLAGVRALITPGTMLMLTDAPISVSTRSGTGFRILTTAEIP
jgi:L,D-transpeptidase catalytic domain